MQHRLLPACSDTFSTIWVARYLITSVLNGFVHKCSIEFGAQIDKTSRAYSGGFVTVPTKVDGFYLFIYLFCIHRRGSYVLCIHPCLFVCLWASISKSYWRIRTKLGWRGWVCDEDELMRIWWRTRSGFGYQNFKSDSSGAKNDL